MNNKQYNERNRQYPPTAETQTKKWFQFDETLKIEARFAWAVGVWVGPA